MKSVLVGVSGGVDSTFAAIRLAENGYKVLAVNFLLTNDYQMPSKITELFSEYDIEFYTLDIRDRFKKIVVDNFVDAYKNGTTPNPCSICNPKIKFNILRQEADKKNIDFIATGHYANIEEGYIKKHFSSKDQSYFLSYLPKEIIVRTIFPLNIYKKNQVKLSIPLELKESNDLCFINDYRSLVNESRSGFIIHEGKIIGTHTGYHKYTIGQRKGIKYKNEPYYVKHINPKNGNITIANRTDLYSDKFSLDDIYLKKNADWFEKNIIDCVVRFRAKSAKALFNPKTNVVLLNEPLFAITKGQIAVFYHNDLIVGCGRISDEL